MPGTSSIAIKKLAGDSKKVEQLYTRIDANGDELIDTAELDAFVTANKQAFGDNSQQLKDLMCRVDYNDDGKLNRREFAAWVETLKLSTLGDAALAKARTLKQQQAFRYFDANKNGLLTLDEVRAILSHPVGGQPYSKEEALQIIGRHDRNADGELDFEEFAEWWARAPGAAYDPKARKEALAEQGKLEAKQREREAEEAELQRAKEQAAKQLVVAREAAARKEAALGTVPEFVEQGCREEYAARKAARAEAAQGKAMAEFTQAHPNINDVTEVGSRLRRLRQMEVAFAREVAEADFDDKARAEHEGKEAAAKEEHEKLLERLQAQWEERAKARAEADATFAAAAQAEKEAKAAAARAASEAEANAASRAQADARAVLKSHGFALSPAPPTSAAPKASPKAKGAGSPRSATSSEDKGSLKTASGGGARAAMALSPKKPSGPVAPIAGGSGARAVLALRTGFDSDSQSKLYRTDSSLQSAVCA